MAGAGKANGKLAKNLIKYSVRYGPFVIEAVRQLREGSLLKVIKDGESIFFVFSGDAIVTTYPPVPQSAYPELLRHSDLDQRVTADEIAARKPKIAPRLPKIRRR